MGTDNDTHYFWCSGCGREEMVGHVCSGSQETNNTSDTDEFGSSYYGGGSTSSTKSRGLLRGPLVVEIIGFIITMPIIIGGIIVTGIGVLRFFVEFRLALIDPLAAIF